MTVDRRRGRPTSLDSLIHSDWLARRYSILPRLHARARTHTHARALGVSKPVDRLVDFLITLQSMTLSPHSTQ